MKSSPAKKVCGPSAVSATSRVNAVVRAAMVAAAANVVAARRAAVAVADRDLAAATGKPEVFAGVAVQATGAMIAGTTGVNVRNRRHPCRN